MNHIVYEPYAVHELESAYAVTLVDSVGSLHVRLCVCRCTIYSYCCITPITSYRWMKRSKEE